MRQIQFRGKRLDNQEWIEGNYVVYAEEDGEDVHCIVSRERGMVDASLNFTPINPETVGQLTGLLDKNGVAIYEGDICVAKTTSAKFSVEFSSIGYNFMACSLSDRAPLSWLADNIHGIEVIGNIHDNKELLK